MTNQEIFNSMLDGTHPQTTEATEMEQYSSDSGRIFLEMTLEDAESVSHSGQCDDDVKGLSQRQDIAKQLDAIDADYLRRELKEYGAWDADELADHDQNLQRLLWLAGGSIVDWKTK